MILYGVVWYDMVWIAWVLCGKVGTFLGMAEAGLDFDVKGLKLVHFHYYMMMIFYKSYDH
jgi:predicted branched-subunit amino acid permease